MMMPPSDDRCRSRPTIGRQSSTEPKRVGHSRRTSSVRAGRGRGLDAGGLEADVALDDVEVASDRVLVRPLVLSLAGGAVGARGAAGAAHRMATATE
jgi:hypothetical protein